MDGMGTELEARWLGDETYPPPLRRRAEIAEVVRRSANVVKVTLDYA
jgi:hypothetical protein